MCDGCSRYTTNAAGVKTKGRVMQKVLLQAGSSGEPVHAEGKPAIDPARLALVTLVQFAESLSDARMADAMRLRIDLNYLLAAPSSSDHDP
jgi:Transposase domain (DUF772)